MAVARRTIPRVFLGEAVRQLRTESGKSIDDAAAKINKDRPRLIKFFDGEATLSPEELKELTSFLGAKGARRKEILELGVEARKKATSGPYIDKGPNSHRRLAFLEAIASDVASYEKGIFPGLVQGPDYLRATMLAADGIWWSASDDEVESRVSAREQRIHNVFESSRAKRVELYFSEDAFSAVFGDQVVMLRQFEHMARLIKKYRQILTVRVVPIDAVDNPAPSGGITVFEFGSLLRPVASLPVVYGPSTYFDKAEDIDRMRAAIKRIREELALSAEESERIINRKAEGY